MDGYCLVGLVVVCLFVTLWVYLLKKVFPSPCPTLSDLCSAFKNSATNGERITVFIWGTVFASRMATAGSVVALAAAAFGALGAMCNSIDLEVVRQMLLDFYAFLERIL